MNFDPQHFWGTDYDRNPPLTEQALREAEHTLGVRFPPELVALWRVQNGGYTQGFVYPTRRRTTWAEDHVPLTELFGIGPSDATSGIHNILIAEYLVAEWGMPPNLVPLTGDGHWWIVLDYRKDGEPRVTWLDVEVGQDIELAPSFGQFLSGLLPASAVDCDTGRVVQ